jgi:hypothetical protein
VGGLHGPSESVGKRLNHMVRQHGRRLGRPCGSNDRRKDNPDADQVNDHDYREQQTHLCTRIVAETGDPIAQMRALQGLFRLPEAAREGSDEPRNHSSQHAFLLVS